MMKPTPKIVAAAAFSAALTLLVLDLLFLGVVAKSVFDEHLGALRADEVYWPAAALFYAMYVGAITKVALDGSSNWDAARRGAALGFVCYATYELTNWAVIRDWPGALVPIDITWGVVLTAATAGAARAAANFFDD